jgi:hypothetical protein
VAALATATIIDRIAIIIGTSIIKDSDIDRDVRATELLNNQPLDVSLAKRKESASRLIDQVFIRREIELGDYAMATDQEADQQLAKLIKQRYKTEAAYRAACQRYGLPPVEMRTQFQWQLSVLRFIDERFKPGVLVTDDEIEKYYHDHAAELQREYPGKSLDELREKIRDILTAQGVDKQFFSWLDYQRKDNKIQYLETDLE